jgi:caa(3)-type oxidase subunit IV
VASTPTAAPDPDLEHREPLPEHPAGHGQRAHPSDGIYMIVALILAGLTAIEVTLYYVKGGTANTVALLVLMAVKFVIVAGFFMHLRFDNLLLRRLFIAGISFASFCYISVLFMFGAFHF